MSLDAVKRKIQALHAQADGAEERALSLQRELELERQQRENVSDGNAIHFLSSFPSLSSFKLCFPLLFQSQAQWF